MDKNQNAPSNILLPTELPGFVDLLPKLASRLTVRPLLLMMVDGDDRILCSSDQGFGLPRWFDGDDGFVQLKTHGQWIVSGECDGGCWLNGAYFHWVCESVPTEEHGACYLYMVSDAKVMHSWMASLLHEVVENARLSLSGASFRRKIDDTHLFTFAIMNAMKIGVMALDPAGQILFANNATCQTLGIRRRELLKVPIGKLVQNWSSIYQIVSEGGKFINEEIVVMVNQVKTKYNVNISPINADGGRKLVGMVITLRELENVYNLVNKYTGMQARFTFEDIVVKGLNMRKLVEYARTIADSPSTVLIGGESGTGKEVFAQSIHNASSRRDHGFVAINCAAIPENLIESELFGYDEGAFTGARKGGNPGKFELAHNGTLFLDEIGDMKPEMQAKLLRAIQEGQVVRVGGDKTIPVNVRLIAATNKDLGEEVREGRFRLDLYYRLSVIPLMIPPLRERKEDLPSLIKYFISKKSIKLQKEIPILRYSQLQELLDYAWPGNIRELENYIEQFVNLSGNLAFDDYLRSRNVQPVTIRGNSSDSLDGALLLSIEQMERNLIENTIHAFNHNMSQAAKSLGISRNTLYQKMKRYRI